MLIQVYDMFQRQESEKRNYKFWDIKITLFPEDFQLKDFFVFLTVAFIACQNTLQ